MKTIINTLEKYAKEKGLNFVWAVDGGMDGNCFVVSFRGMDETGVIKRRFTYRVTGDDVLAANCNAEVIIESIIQKVEGWLSYEQT